MPLPTKVRVTTFESELEFTIQNKTLGQTLFDQVIQTTGIREVNYHISYKIISKKTYMKRIYFHLKQIPMPPDKNPKFTFRLHE